MDKTTLLQSQPMVARILSNALLHDRISHAYLFVGSKAAPKKEMALLMAQSLVCDHPNAQGFACGQCDQCLKIQNHTYADLVDIDPFLAYEKLKANQGASKTKKNDGSTKPKPLAIPRIAKDEIAQLQSFFATSAMERTGWKIYIINGLERMSEEAGNALLKFLEEPKSEKICALLIAESSNNVLSTIVSRCQTIRFQGVSHQVISDRVLESGADDLSALMASYLWRGETMEEWTNSRSVNDALGMVVQLIASDNRHFRETAIKLENDVVLSTGFTKECGKYIFDMLYIIYMLQLKDPTLLNGLTIRLQPKNITRWLLILTQASAKCDGTYYYPLVYEQTISRLAKEL